MRKMIVIAAGVSVALSGCVSPERRAERFQLLGGLPTALEEAGIESSTTAQVGVFKSLYKRARGSGAEPRVGDKEWDLVIAAGFDYVDERCEAYMDAVFWANRSRESTLKNLGQTASSTEVILGLSGASATAISIVAAAFGLTTSLYDVSSSALLYELEPSAVRSVVVRSRKAFSNAVLRNYLIETSAIGDAGAAVDARQRRNLPGASSAIRGYLALCLPAGIERQIINSLATQTFEAEGGGVSPDIEPRGAPGAVSPEVLQELRDSVERLEAFDPQAAIEGVGQRDPNPECLGDTECGAPKAEIASVQSALCVRADGQLGGQTRAAIDEWRFAVNPNVTETALGEGLAQDEWSYLAEASACSATKFKTAFERGLLFDTAFIENAATPLQEAIENGRDNLLAWLARAPNGGSVSVSVDDMPGDQARGVFKAVREASFPSESAPSGLDDVLTKKIYCSVDGVC